MFQTNLNNCRMEIRKCIEGYYSDIKAEYEIIEAVVKTDINLNNSDSKMSMVEMIKKYESDKTTNRNLIVESYKQYVKTTKEDIITFEAIDFNIISVQHEDIDTKKEELNQDLKNISIENIENEDLKNIVENYDVQNSYIIIIEQKLIKDVNSLKLSIFETISKLNSEKKESVLKIGDGIYNISLSELLERIEVFLFVYLF